MPMLMWCAVTLGIDIGVVTVAVVGFPGASSWLSGAEQVTVVLVGPPDVARVLDN